MKKRRTRFFDFLIDFYDIFVDFLQQSVREFFSGLPLEYIGNDSIPVMVL